MGEQLTLNVEQLPMADVDEQNQPIPPAVERKLTGKNLEFVGPSSSMLAEDNKVAVSVEDDEESDEQAPLIGVGECRICQEEDFLHNLESPCACCGSLKFAHRKCVQYWCNEKGDITCEICHQSYQPGYTAPPRPPPDETIIDIGGVWQIPDSPLDMHDPRFLAFSDTERQLFQTDYEDYNVTGSSSTAFYRSAATILLSLLVLRHGMSITDDSDGNGDEDALTSVTLFMTQIVGFLLPFYIILWVISILQRRRQAQEAAALAATRFAIVVQPARNGGGRLLVASAAPATNSHATPLQQARNLEHA